MYTYIIYPHAWLLASCYARRGRGANLGKCLSLEGMYVEYISVHTEKKLNRFVYSTLNWIGVRGTAKPDYQMSSIVPSILHYVIVIYLFVLFSILIWYLYSYWETRGVEWLHDKERLNRACRVWVWVYIFSCISSSSLHRVQMLWVVWGNPVLLYLISFSFNFVSHFSPKSGKYQCGRVCTFCS